MNSFGFSPEVRPAPPISDPLEDYVPTDGYAVPDQGPAGEHPPVPVAKAVGGFAMALAAPASPIVIERFQHSDLAYGASMVAGLALAVLGALYLSDFFKKRQANRESRRNQAQYGAYPVRNLQEYTEKVQ